MKVQFNQFYSYLCGVKANYKTIGVTAKVKLNDCNAAAELSNHVESLAALAQKAGKGTGIVTTTRVTHASPSGAYAHTSSRDYECDTDVLAESENPSQCRDIAKQLVLDETGRNFKVILGGGRGKFTPSSQKDGKKVGQRSDGVNLINAWKQLHARGKYVSNKQELQSLNLKETDQILGLFAHSHMSYNLDADREKEPSLKEMTETAIKLLSKEPHGYFLFVEGGRIDHGHHSGKAKKALDETVEFSKAIQAALDMTNSADTLIVVTSDHAHTMSISGYPTRGNNIVGVGTQYSDTGRMCQY